MRLVRGCVLGGCLFAAASVPACGNDESVDSDSVILGDGVHGPQRVPAGGTLEGEHADETYIESNEAGAAVVVDTEPGKTTTVRGLNVYANGGVGILVRGGGRFVGEDLNVVCGVGVCVAVEGQSKVDLSKVDIRGTITKEVVANLVFPLKAEEAPIIGLAVARVTEATLTDVTIGGFGGFGMISVESRIAWSGGGVSGNVGVGVIQQGGDVTLDTVDVSETWKGQIGNAISSYGLVLTGAGMLHSAALRVIDNEGYGFVQDGARSDHTGLIVSDNDDVGLWLQNSPGTSTEPSLRIFGTNNVFERNRGGGIFALRAGGVDLEGIRAADAIIKEIATSDTGLAQMADGIQITEPVGDIRLNALQLDNNARIGLLLSGALPTGATVSIGGVQITGSGDYGMLPQDQFPPPDDAAVSRTPDLAAKDAASTAPLPPAGVKAAFVSVATLADNGLIGENSIISTDGSVSSGGAVDKDGLSSTGGTP
jgi:hypothetical protein